MAARTALRRALGAAAQLGRGAATRAPHASALPAWEAAALPPWHALGGSLRGFASRSRSPRDVSRALESLRRKREALAAAKDGEAPSSSPGQAPPPLSPDVARAAVAAGGSLTPHNATAVAFTPAALAPVFSRSALIVTREIEWGTIVLGFEQANKYTIRDANGEVVAYLAEETPSIASAIGRQLLRRRRAMTATVMSPAGDVIFRVRRPLYLINSQMNIEDASGEVVGEVIQRWHAWRRHYDVYVRKRQFAQVRSGLLAWEFTLQDEQGRPLAQIDRNFQGFGKELFTDAGMYAIHFGDAMPGPEGLTAEDDEDEGVDAARAPPAAPTAAPPAASREPPPPASSDALAPGADTWHPPVPVRPLALSERAVCLALAIAVDFDYFSQHSSGNSGLMAGMMMPMPVPMGGGSGEAAGTEAGAAAGAADESPAADEPPAAAPERDWRDRENLGGDEPFKADDEAPTWSDSPDDVDASDDDDGDDDDGGGGGGWGLLRDVFNQVTGNDDDE